VARDTDPTIVSYTATASFVTAGASKSTSAAVTWQTGDILVFVAGCAQNGTIGVPTATGLTFTSAAVNTAASTCASRAAYAVAGANGSQTVSASNSNTTDQWGFGVWVLRGSDGFGQGAEQHTATRTKAITATDAHSFVCWGVFDFAAVATVALTPTPTNTRLSSRSVSNYTQYIADLVPAATGSTSYGVGGAGTGPFSIVIVEILGTTSADPVPPPLVMAPYGH